jgi:hypothetical protein
MTSKRLGLFVAGVLVLGAAVAIVVAGPDETVDTVMGWTDRLQSVAADAPEQDLAARRAAPGEGSLLIVVTDDNGAGAAFGILTRSGDGPLTLAVVPSTLYDLLPGFGEFPLSDATVFEDEDLAVMTLENTLGIQIDAVAVVPAEAFGEVLDGSVTVDLPNQLVVEREDGVVAVVASEGVAGRSPEQLADIFTLQGSSDSLEWLERQAAAWEGLVVQVASDAQTLDRFTALAGSGSAVAEGLLVAEGEGLEVTLIPVSTTGAGDDQGFTASQTDIRSFVDRWMPHLATSTDLRPRVELLNGNGRVGTTRSVANVLIDQGYHVVRTDNAESFTFETTVVVAQGRENADPARRAVTLLGVGDLQLELRAPSGVVDLSIIVGQDIPSGEG